MSRTFGYPAKLNEQPRLASCRSGRSTPSQVRFPDEYTCHSWLVDDGARERDWTLMDVGPLAPLLAAFASRYPSLPVGGCFEDDDGGMTRSVRGHTAESAEGCLYVRVIQKAAELSPAGLVRAVTARASSSG